MQRASKTLWSNDNQDDVWLNKPLTLRKGNTTSHLPSSLSPNIEAFKHTHRQVVTSSYKSSQSHQTMKSLVKRNEVLAKELGKLQEINSQQNDKIRELNFRS